MSEIELRALNFQADILAGGIEPTIVDECLCVFDEYIDQLREKLEAAESEVKRLESAWHAETLNRKDQIIADQESENDRLRQVIREAREQRPVAEVLQNVIGVEFGWVDPWNKVSVGTKLYAAPVPAPKS